MDAIDITMNGICYKSFTALSKGFLYCGCCKSTFNSQFKSDTCSVCHIGQIGEKKMGIELKK